MAAWSFGSLRDSGLSHCRRVDGADLTEGWRTHRVRERSKHIDFGTGSCYPREGLPLWGLT